MRHNFSALKRTSCIAALGLSLIVTVPLPGHAGGWPVFDALNYVQNILTASQTLIEINQQVDQLRNEAEMLVNMDLNLRQLTDTLSPELATALNEINALLDQADAIRLEVQETDQAMRELFPEEFAATLSGDEALQNAQVRWSEALNAYKRSASLQAKVSESAVTDGANLATLLSRSRTAVGNLQASQAGNELSGLAIKQSLQVQQLMAAQYRAETMDRARRLASEEEARVRFNSFVGNASAYSPDG